jgi:hypothetical protein
MKIMTQIAAGFFTAAIIGTIMLKLKSTEVKQQDRLDDVSWTSVEVDSSYSVSSTQKVSRVILGLRKDGVVVWKEESLNDSTSSRMFFEPCDNTKVGEVKAEAKP